VAELLTVVVIVAEEIAAAATVEVTAEAAETAEVALVVIPANVVILRANLPAAPDVRDIAVAHAKGQVN